jgi:hypothetical protein
VLFVLGGINGYYDTSFYGNEIESAGNMVKKYGGKIGHAFFNAEQYRHIILKEKIKYALIILLGAAGAIGGTMMMKNSASSKIIYDEDEDGFELDTVKDERFRL